MRTRDSLWLAVSLALPLCPTPSRGDDAGVTAVGGSIRPMVNGTSIRMIAEYVHIDFVRGDPLVECVFFLENHGPDTVVTIGFPNFSGGADVESVRPFSAFASYVDGDSVAVTVEPDAEHQEYGDYGAWYVKTVAFDAQQIRCIRNVYEGTRGGDSAGYSEFDYVLWSGATWAGTIGAADIVVTWDPGAAPLDSVEVRPKGHHSSGNEIRWHFTDLEPQRLGDLGVIELRWKRLWR